MNAGSLAIHVVDATRDAAAEGLRIEVYFLGEHAAKLCSGKVGAAGLVEDPVFASGAIVPGEYEIVLHIGEFYRTRGVAASGSPSFDAVLFRFGIADAAGVCRLPVRIGPWGFAAGGDPASREAGPHLNEPRLTEG